MPNERWKCPKCGVENDFDNNFCGDCGKKKPEREIGIATAGKAVQKQINPEPTPSEEIIPKKESKKKNNKGMIFTLLAVIGVIILVVVELQYQAENQKESAHRHQCESEDRLFPCTDSSTGLVWSDRSSSTMKWSSAKQYCANLNEDGYSDWRLPTISELKTTIKNCQSGGSSCGVSDSCLSGECWSDNCYCAYKENNGGYYSKLSDDDNVYLWSSSTQSGNTNSAWRVVFSKGLVGNDGKSYDGYVRCVRK